MIIILSGLAAVVFSILSIRFILVWTSKMISASIVGGVQQMIDKMKEYELDTRAGLVVCRGRQLEVQYMDPSLKTLLGTPRSVEEMLPPEFRHKHTKLVQRFVGGNPLPDSLNHPLRNVQILNGDHQLFRAKIIIGKFKFHQFLLEDLFYVIIQPLHTRSNKIITATNFRKSSYSYSSDSPSDASEFACMCEQEPWDFEQTKFVENEKDVAKGMVEIYGLGAASYIDRGLVPATERYAQATVLYMDIVDFTRHCMAKQLDEISGWMTRIHTTVDELLERFAIRKVETRGDCVICVSGTNFVPSEGGASRDLCGDQVTRMLAFGHDLGLALSGMDGTAARIGMATGPVVLTHIAHGGDALPAKYIYGDTVNVACRMEQTGRVGAVQLAESAARVYAVERGMAVPPLRSRDVKGKGIMRTAMYDCAGNRFLDGPALAALGDCPAVGSALPGSRRESDAS